MSLATVDAVFVKCGFSGFEVWNFRYASAVSLARLLCSVKSVHRGAYAENERVVGREMLRRALDERFIIREDDIVVYLVVACSCGGQLEAVVRRGEMMSMPRQTLTSCPLA
jgi:hypothetical protein